jgi:hypothetical protein
LAAGLVLRSSDSDNWMAFAEGLASAVQAPEWLPLLKKDAGSDEQSCQVAVRADACVSSNVGKSARFSMVD